MNPQIFNQHPLLHAYIKDIRTMQSDTLKNSTSTFPFFADGLPGIMFHQSEYDVFLNQNEKKLSTLFLYGHTVKPIEISYKGNFQIIVIYLYPHVMKSLFGIEARELTNTCLDFELLSFAGIKDLIEQLSENTFMENKVQLIANFLLNLIKKDNATIEKDLQYVTDHLVNANGNIPLKKFQNELKVSERTFERKFQQHVGISPRLYARICRFQSALSQLRSNDYLKLTDVAYESGFADQSHFIRTFKEFTGYTPREYLVNYQLVSGEF